VVVVDAYRASTTVAVLVEKGARVLPVAGIEEALGAEADYRIGERGSAKVQGFDFGNSPTEVREARLKPGATVALSTTNGTRIVEAARGAVAILAGAFVNAGAVADRLASGDMGGQVVVVGCGWRGRRSSEDESAAGEILARLRERGAILDGRAEAVVEAHRERPERLLRTNAAARRLKRLGYGGDLDLCLALDAVPVVPLLVDGAFVEAPGV
jgi:2-phosphosulfolactate phosphatase